MSNYLVLDETINTVDYLESALHFLKDQENKMSLKWFIIAFHGAIYGFMLLRLKKVNPEQIFNDNKIDKISLDRNLISFKKAYLFIKNEKNTSHNPFISSNIEDAAMEEINDQIRNQMLHFRPILWAAEPWYFADTCLPLINILNYCITHSNLTSSQSKKVIECTESINMILKGNASS